MILLYIYEYIRLTFETNAIECLNALRCHGTWLSFRVLPVGAALSHNPPTELGVGRIPFRHVAVTELRLVLTQLFKPFVPIVRFLFPLRCSPVNTNTNECSNMLRFHDTWFSFVIQLEVAALSHNPITELGVGRIPFRHVAVAEVRLEFTQFLKSFVSKGHQISLGCSRVETNNIECSNVLGCHETWLFCVIQL